MELEKKDQAERDINQVLDEQTVGTSNHHVNVLELDGVVIKSLTLATQQRLQRYSALQVLSMISCQLSSLEFFPHLPQLLRLELVNNEIQGADLHYLAGCRHLQALVLSHNHVTSDVDLQPLAGLKNLLQLDLYGNPVTEIADYRRKVFKIFAHLEILDQEDANGEFQQATMNQALQRIPSAVLENKKASVAQQAVIKRLSQTSIPNRFDNNAA